MAASSSSLDLNFRSRPRAQIKQPKLITSPSPSQTAILTKDNPSSLADKVLKISPPKNNNSITHDTQQECLV